MCNISSALAAKEASDIFGIDEELAKALLNCHYLCRLHKMKRPSCEHVVIDEFPFQDGYITIPIDADNHTPVCLFDGKKARIYLRSRLSILVIIRF